MIALDLRGHTALVTGASGQLGRVMAQTLAQAGANVAIHFLSHADNAGEVRREAEKAGVRAIIVQADVTRREEVLQMRDEVRRELGDPDIIVNNAVIQFDWTSVLNQPEADFESQFRSSVLQNVFMAQAFVPAMVERGGGRVIAISTECAVQNLPGQAAYASGKRGMDGVLRVLAREVGQHGITVNQVAPGWTISERVRREGTISQPEYEAGIPLRRRGEDREIANVVAFLASPLASYVTGAFIPVCGGNVMLGI